MRLFSAHDLSKSKAIKDKSQGKPSAKPKRPLRSARKLRGHPSRAQGRTVAATHGKGNCQNQPIGRSAYQSARPKGSHYITNGTEIKGDSEPLAIDDLQTKDKFVFAVAGWNF